MRLAAIDVGTNSVLLTVAERGPAGLVPLSDRAEITRLGKGVDATGRLSDEGIARTLEVLRCYEAEARRLSVDRLACVATSAARDAANGAQFLEQVRALGLSPEIIGGEREAQLSFLAARRDFGRAGDPLAVLDVGGGSTEITFGRNAPAFRTSLEVGSVRLFERHVRSDPPSHAERLAVRATLDAALAPLPAPPAGAELVGVAGTLTTLATLALGLPAYDAARVHGAKLSLYQISALTNRLWSLPVADRRALPGLQPLRADVIPVGASIVEAVLFRLRFPEVTISDRGVRWGLLHELAA